MKTRKVGLALAAMLTTSALFAQVPKGYEVAPWKNFCTSTLTYSFDDNTPNQVPVAVPVLEKYNYRGSFNLITSWVEDWSPWKAIAERGHEISSHTITHPNLAEKDLATQEKELKESKEVIEREIGKECVTFVYPYCIASDLDVTKKYYISGRSCNGQIVPYTPENMFDISSRGVGDQYTFDSAKNFNAWADQAYEQKGWAVYLIHGIDDDGGYSPIKSSELDAHLSYVSADPKKFWVATFVEVSKYILERNSLKIDESCAKKTITLNVSCTATSSVTKLDQPVTISRKLSGKQKVSKVTTGSESVSYSVENGKVIFNVVPGKTYVIKL